ncbi:MAG: porin [Pirellulales bacterium]|nr:porin [Pirellulales bacterium]
MKVSKWAMLIALAGGMSAATAMAQYGQRQPRVAQTGIEYGSYYQASAQMPAGSPSDMAPATAPMEAAPPAAEAAPVASYAGGCTDGTCTSACPTDPGCAANCTNGACDPGCGADAACGCDSGCGTGCEECKLECEDRDDPWRLFGHCNESNCHDLNFRGWVAAGYFGNFDNPASNWNGPVTFGDRDEPLLNQLYFIAEKQTVANTEAGDIGWGGRIDLLYGSDYRFNISRGLSARDNFTAKWDTNRFYGLDLPQLYAEVGNKKLNAKLGRFYTIIGYQVVTAPDNFFYSIPYTFQYGEPFTHTGALVTYNANDQLALFGGITNGWDNFDNVVGYQSVLYGATFTASDGNSKLAVAGHYGKDSTTFGIPEPTDDRHIMSIVYSRTLTDRLSYVFQSDNGYQENVNNSGERGEWYGINQYLFYKINCSWTAGIRAEWFRDDDGTRVAAVGDYPALGFSTNPASTGGWAGNFYDVALGANWKPYNFPNLTVRPEIRYDWYDGPVNAGGTNPYDDGASDNQWLIGGDVIYVY